MATGPWHYRAAEREILEALKEEPDTDQFRALMWKAEIHARLAVAAATVDAAYGRMPTSIDEKWDKVIHTNGMAGPPVPLRERGSYV
jgi:hypothetical protein